MSGLTLDDLNIPSSKEIPLPPALVSEAKQVDTDTAQPPASAPAPVSMFDEDEEDLAGEIMVDGIELALQLFGHPKYALSEGKRAVLEGAYSKLAKKYGQKAPAGLGRFKEEVVVIILTLVVVGGGYRTIVALKNEEATPDTQGAKHGHQRQ